MNDYQKTISVNKPISEVYAALTEHIPEWWSNDFIGASAHAGDSFTIAFGKTIKTFDIVEAVPDDRIVWKCVKAHIDMASLKNKAEWVGTEIIWKLSVVENSTNVFFRHEGLNQYFECYEVCEAGWDQFLASFQACVTSGKGTPYIKR
jgi:uncharacterized protein YndB with AHSA1/START domain